MSENPILHPFQAWEATFCQKNHNGSTLGYIHILVAGTRTRSVMWSLYLYIVWSDEGTLLEYPAHLRRSRNFHLYARLLIGVWCRHFWKYILYVQYCIFRYIYVMEMLLRDGGFWRRMHHKTALILIIASLTHCVTLVIIFSYLHQDKILYVFKEILFEKKHYDKCSL